MRVIAITSMLVGTSDYPLVPGSKLEKLGKFLGVPDRWDFGIEDEFTCQLGYADFEFSLRTRSNCDLPLNFHPAAIRASAVFITPLGAVGATGGNA